jgi:hypothetical protein
VSEPPPSERDDRPTGREALSGALADRRRHAGALLLVGAAIALALLFDTPSARYGAGLVVFAVWMGWFVLTCIAFVERAEF